MNQKKLFNIEFVKILYFSSVFIFSSCYKNNNEINDFYYNYNKEKLFKTGKLIYNKNCVTCHGNINANDNTLKKNSTVLDFKYFKNFVTKQDSLLNNFDSKTLKIKSEYGNNQFIHKFSLNKNELKVIAFYINYE